MDVREKLVELINQVQETGANVLFNGFGETYDWVDNEKVAAHLVSRNVTVQEWISVNDRLPEENTEVLIYCKTNSGKEVFFVDKICYFRGLPIWQVWSEKVTHWMPLPQPPKGE